MDSKRTLPIHVYHKFLWKEHFKHHFYRVCHGFLIPIYQIIFGCFPPRLSNKAKIDLSSIRDWFGEEKFTYIRIFGSIFQPHILPLYVPDKLLAQEISYQLTVEGMSRILKSNKKLMWHTFHFKCGDYTLNSFSHAEKEVGMISNLKFSTIPGRQYDPRKVAHDFTTSVSIARFEHEPDIFDDLFVSMDDISQVFDSSKSKLHTEDLKFFVVV